jgi:hypothetical protein
LKLRNIAATPVAFKVNQMKDIHCVILRPDSRAVQNNSSQAIWLSRSAKYAYEVGSLTQANCRSPPSGNERRPSSRFEVPRQISRSIRRNLPRRQPEQCQEHVGKSYEEQVCYFRNEDPGQVSPHMWCIVNYQQYSGRPRRRSTCICIAVWLTCAPELDSDRQIGRHDRS